MGLEWSDDAGEPIPTGRYYTAEDFYQWYLGNIAEPSYKAIPEYVTGFIDWFGNNLDIDWEDDILGDTGAGYDVWRF